MKWQQIGENKEQYINRMNILHTKNKIQVHSF